MIDRRRAIALSLTAAALPAASTPSFGQEPQFDYSDRRIGKWFNQIKDKAHVGVLSVSRFPDVEMFYVKNDKIVWTADPPHDKKHKNVRVPFGFLTDLASSPQVMWWLLPPHGAYMQAAVVHDYMYWQQDRSREDADEVLKIGMEELGVPTWKIQTIYATVRLGGQSAWDENKSRRGRGERKILKKLPDSPAIKFVDWTKRADVWQ